ncbi:MAG TPA: hypothetical protein VIC87_13645 [Vicinamibacteria bacterium]
MRLQDASGCLSLDGIAAVGAAAPGRIPAELAAHLASCARCPERVLTGGVPRPTRKERPDPPSIKRALLLVGLIVLSIFAFLWTLRQLTG